jgi:protein involved in sex pheromone biosynthesis
VKKLSIWIIGALLLLVGCAPDVNEDKVVQDNESNSKEKQAIVPSYQLSEENYKMILPFEPGKARGVIVDQVANRLDIDEMEEGLRRHSKDVYDPSKYLFQEGQYITEESVIEWIDKLNPKKKEKADKNYYEKNPRYLSHILEQDYLVKKEDNSVSLQGISIGIAMKSNYQFQTETGGPTYETNISQAKMMEQANKIAQKIMKDVRKIKGLEKVPVMMAIYREEAQSSPVPGNFVAKTTIPEGSSTIGDWEKIDEEYVLFPSEEGKKKYYEDQEIVNSFGKEIATYFPNYVGIIGQGFYVDGKLQKMTIEIPIEFYGRSEVVGFTQYAYGLIQEMFADHYALEVKITSSDKLESFIYRDADAKKPTVHILD